MAELGAIFPETSAITAFVIACVAIVIVPGPTVTVIVANSLRDGARAGLLNVAGTQLGLAMMLVIVALGLEFITTTLAFLFDWLRLAGAAYLIYLGYRLLRSDGSLQAGQRRRPGGSFFWQGFIVIWSNPKALLFFGAFIPQFVDPTANAAAQSIVLGVIFMIVGVLLDGAYAVAAGRAGSYLTKQNIRRSEIVCGSLLIGGGIWLAASR